MRSAKFIAPLVERAVAGLVVGPALPGPAGDQPLVIGTHDGSFHCDEAMACGLLRATATFRTASVVRTRAPPLLADCKIVVDVGSVYDHAALRYDHHQKEFQGTMDTGKKVYKTRLSSAGLVYKHYGREVLRSYLEECAATGRVSVAAAGDADALEVLYDKVYSSFIEHVDGIDNGVEQFAAADATATLVKNYDVSTTLSERVKSLLPRWNEEAGRVEEDAAFADAVRLTLTEFYEKVDFFVCAWMPAREAVRAAFESAKGVDPSGAIVVFQNGGCPWKDHLFTLEQEAGVVGRTLYALFPDGKGNWRVQCVPQADSSFANRKSLPWRGLRDEALSTASGISGGIFVHVTGFIGGNNSFDGALAMARKAVAMTEEEADAKRPRE